MDLQIKVFRWPNQANHVIMLARGTIDVDGFKQIFDKVAEISGPLFDCKILIDLLDAKCRLEPGDIDECFHGLGLNRLSHGSKVALISTQTNERHACFGTISATLSKQGVKVAGFEDSSAAAAWLVESV